MRGLGIGLGLQAPGGSSQGPSPVWSDDDLSDWSPTNVTVAAFSGTDPETGLSLVSALETAVVGNHYISNDLPLEQGKTYRLRVLLKGEGRSLFQFYLPTADGGKLWIGTLGSAVPAFASGMSNPTVEAVGDMFAHTVDFTLSDVSGNYGLSLVSVIPGPNNNFLGEVTKGLVFGNVSLFEV